MSLLVSVKACHAVTWFSVFFCKFCSQSLWCLALYQKKRRDYDSCLDFTCSTQGSYADIILNLTSAHLLRFSALLPSIFFWLVKERALFQSVLSRVRQLVSSWTAGVSTCFLEWSVKSRSAGLYLSLWIHLCCNDGGVESLFQIMRPCFYVLMLVMGEFMTLWDLK